MEGRDVGELNESSKVSLMVKKSCVGLNVKGHRHGFRFQACS